MVVVVVVVYCYLLLTVRLPTYIVRKRDRAAIEKQGSPFLIFTFTYLSSSYFTPCFISD